MLFVNATQCYTMLHNTYIFFTYMCILYPKVKGQLFTGIIIFYKNTSYAILKHHNLEIRVETVFNSTIIPQALRCGLDAGASFGVAATIDKNCSPQMHWFFLHWEYFYILNINRTRLGWFLPMPIYF